MTQIHDQPGGAESSRSSELILTPAEVAETPRYPSLWRNRDFMLLWSSQLLSSVGSQVSLLAFPLLVLGITHSATQAGLVGALDSLPFALLCLPAGALIDRWDRKRVMLICDTGRALALGSIPVALWLGRLGLLQLCLVALIEGTLMTFFSVAEIACLPHVVPKAQITAASAQNQAINSTSWTLGPFLGGFLYGMGHAVPFLTDAISYVCSVLSIFLMRARFQEERTEEPRKIWHEIGEGLLWLWREHVLRFLALLTLVLVFSTIGFTLILIVLAQNLHATPLAIGMLFASGGVGSIVGAVLSSPLQKRFTFGQLTIGSAWVWAVSWLALAVAPNLWVLGVANGVSFIVVPIFYSVQLSYRMIAIPDHLQGRVQSVFRLLSLGSQPLGLALTGLLIQWIGPGQTVVLLFVPQALIALFTTLNRRLRAIPSLSELARKEPG
ncbi:MFS transporter [Ktedonobacter sp. SOSP1-85]|uniref:MFS transporter n=1 Tax=Ktedonobacter sp. SOSP1-85 TaxID=2778367 RepID=UPI00191651B2|nr:MFS transporter [Ktedonobacter sp. SOSP1-85]GHO72534.1 MFS transporter [Ktedonobacter sp. SOSP1-85]